MFSLPSSSSIRNNKNYTLRCAFHQQAITNFCKDSNCLLPLCPRCIKLHSQHHANFGIVGKFETIQECIVEVTQSYESILASIHSIRELQSSLYQIFQHQVINIQRQFQLAKSKFYEQLQIIFHSYESSIKQSIMQQQRKLSEEIYKSRGNIDETINKSKIYHKQLSNPNLILETLINYYSQAPSQLRIKYYQDNLQHLQPSLPRININQHQLHQLNQIIHSYLQLDGHVPTHQLDGHAPTHQLNKISDIESSHSKRYISSVVSEKLGEMDKFESPLERYSLERKRQLRIKGRHDM